MTAETKTYVAEQRQPTGNVTTRTVPADGYVWAGGGVVSFQRETSGDGDVKAMETFATLFDCLSVYESGAVT